MCNPISTIKYPIFNSSDPKLDYLEKLISDKNSVLVLAIQGLTENFITNDVLSTAARESQLLFSDENEFFMRLFSCFDKRYPGTRHIA